MRLATVDNVLYLQQSTLIPHELKPEVEGVQFDVPPVAMSHCPRFLCYHHMYDIVNRQQALRDLYLTIQERYFVTGNKLSNSLTILGVCNAIVGGKGTTYDCYNAALQNEHRVCPTAARWKVNINMTCTFITSAMCIFHSVSTECIVFKELILKLHFFKKGLRMPKSFQKL